MSPPVLFVRAMARLWLATAACILIVSPLAAETPASPWRTIRTPHFRVHYPRPYEAWATRAASRLESIRDSVAREVGFVPPQTIDVVVENPVAEANGEAIPLLDTPRMIFFAEPPEPDEQLGAYAHWIDLLSVHETTHLVHMLRPSRNPLERTLEKSVLPLNPITLRAPRWVLEGYATVLEGRLTGAGRPSSTLRALILRRWAESGSLPTYAQLDSDRRFLGMSMAYLMGSAYLEWLEQRGGPDSLRNLWARLTARHRRSFEEAFTGVYGESPDRLYGRFVAELTASAMTIDRAAPAAEGELWQQTSWSSGDLAVSPDGSQLAIVLRSREDPARLVVWSTAAPSKEEEKFDKRVKEILARDPEDVAPVRVIPLPRKSVAELTMRDGGDIAVPRWTPDGKSIVFAHRAPDASGDLHFDLYRWDGLSRVVRITDGADVHEADPLRDGRTAVGVRNRYGASQLVDVDLATGVVTARTPPSIDTVYSHPRVSAGGRVAHVAHVDGRWTLLVDGVRVDLPGDASSPEWISADELVVTLSHGGFAELHRVRLDGDSVQVTRARGGAFAPAPSRDGRVFFMSLDPDGYVVRVLPAGAMEVAAAAPLDAASLVPAVPPAPPTPPVFAASAMAPPRDYGIGRQETSWFFGQTVARRHRAFEAGVRLGDVVGRLDTIAIASIGRDDAPRGGAIATAWRGWPVEVDAHAYAVRRLDESGKGSSGLELRGVWSRRFPLSRLTVEGGALSEGTTTFASALFATRQQFGSSRLEESLRLEGDHAEGSHVRGIAGAAFRAGDFRIAARYQHDNGGEIGVGGARSSVLPRSFYLRTVIDPALPMATLSGSRYDGLRVETTIPMLPFTAFYQRHDANGTRLALAGLEMSAALPPTPIVKTPGLDVSAGVARVLDEPLRGRTQWWIAMRWRP